MQKVIYSKKGGLGVVLEHEEREHDFFIPKNFVINGNLLETNDFTTLDGLFNENVRYVGVLKSNRNCMCFCLGSASDLFQSNVYYSCFFYISENRLVNKYTPDTARDFRFKNGEWK